MNCGREKKNLNEVQQPAEKLQWLAQTARLLQDGQEVQFTKAKFDT
jgi:hypothetical protein